MGSSLAQTEVATILIFGATGDLTARKLMPALYKSWKIGYLSKQSPIVGVGRREKDDAVFRQDMFTAVRQSSRGTDVSTSDWETFAGYKPHKRPFPQLHRVSSGRQAAVNRAATRYQGETVLAKIPGPDRKLSDIPDKSLG